YSLFLLVPPHPPTSTLLPYTTLFRSYKPLYLKILLETFGGYPRQLKRKATEATRRIEDSIQVVQWGEMKPYSKETFSTIQGWMTSHSLLERPITYEQLVNNRPLERLTS